MNSSTYPAAGYLPKGDTAYPSEEHDETQSASVMPAQGSTPDMASIAIGTPTIEVSVEPQKHISVCANTITQVSYSDDESNVACFDVVFSVGVSCEGVSKTYQVVKRIGIDKCKIAYEAEAGSPVSIVEAKHTAERLKKPIKEELSTAKRFRQLAGLE